MDKEDATYSSSAMALAFLGGAAAGAVVGLLLAPKPGEETRRTLKGYARKAEEDVLEKAKEARAALDETIERGKHFLAANTAHAEAADKVGREATRERVDTCCH